MKYIKQFKMYSVHGKTINFQFHIIPVSYNPTSICEFLVNLQIFIQWENDYGFIMQHYLEVWLA